jgi:cytochrome P450
MYALAQRPDIQARLRDELRAFPLPTAPVGNSPLDPETLAALDKLPLLDAVVRETLRLYAPLPATIRTATVDSVLPLATPYVDRHGVSHAELRVCKSDPIIIPILLLNRSKELWGPDAHEWKCVTRASPPRVRCVLNASRVSQPGSPFR